MPKTLPPPILLVARTRPQKVIVSTQMSPQARDRLKALAALCDRAQGDILSDLVMQVPEPVPAK